MVSGSVIWSLVWLLVFEYGYWLYGYRVRLYVYGFDYMIIVSVIWLMVWLYGYCFVYMFIGLVVWL